MKGEIRTSKGRWKVGLEGRQAACNGFLDIIESCLVHEVKNIRTGICVVEVEAESTGGVSAHGLVNEGIRFANPISNAVVEVIGEIDRELIPPSKTVISEVTGSLSVNGEFRGIVGAF